MELKKDKILKTSRLYLEPLIRKHAALLFAVLQDEQIYAFISEKPPVSISALETRYRILEERKVFSLNQIWLNWALRLKYKREYIGTLQATIYEDNTANIAYVLSPKYWHQGLAYEASVKLLEFLFSEYQIKRVLADVDKNNTLSIKLLRKLSFTIIENQKLDNDYFYELTNEKFQEIFHS